MYADHNATAPLRAVARDAMLGAIERAWANPSSPHRAGRAAAAVLDRARRDVASLGDWDPRGLVFTGSATEANALALTGLTTPEAPLRLVSAVEHPSVLAWGDERIPVDSDGRVLLEALDARLSLDAERVAVVSVMGANNETGVLQPLEEISVLCKRHGVWLHTDATQAVARVPLRGSPDLITLSSHKLGGPRGVGALWIRPDLHPRISPLLRGGPQERGLRGGTENVPAAAGFGAAALAGVAERHDPAQRDALAAACSSLGGRVLGEGAPRLPNTVSALFVHPGDLIVMALDLEGVAASTGSACSSGAAQESHVVQAMGLRGVPVRFSFGADPFDLDHLVGALAHVLKQMEAPCVS